MVAKQYMVWLIPEPLYTTGVGGWTLWLALHSSGHRPNLQREWDRGLWLEPSEFFFPIQRQASDRTRLCNCPNQCGWHALAPEKHQLPAWQKS